MKNTLILFGLLGLLISCQKINPEQEKEAAQSAIKEFYTALEKDDYQTLRSCTTPEFSAFEEGYNYKNIDDFIEAVKSFESINPKINLNFVNTEVYGILLHLLLILKYHSIMVLPMSI